MQIGPHPIDRPLVLSPMVDVTDPAFRSLASENGADVTCSEMVAAAGLAHGNERSWKLVERWPGESPYGVQIMGGEPETMASAVTQVCDREHPDFIDINLGCPSPNILRACAGGFLLRDPEKAGTVIQAAVDAAAASRTPVSVKMRTGPSGERLTYLDVGRVAEAAGAAWCTLHGRTVEQGYSGQADWSAIARLKDELSIPVIGNGDLRGPQDIVAMSNQTGCDGFFIARAAMHDPTVFARMRAALDGHDAPPPPPLTERLRLFDAYLERAAACGYDHIAGVRRQGGRFMAGAPGAKRLRIQMQKADTMADVQRIVQSALLEVP